MNKMQRLLTFLVMSSLLAGLFSLPGLAHAQEGASPAGEPATSGDSIQLQITVPQYSLTKDEGGLDVVQIEGYDSAGQPGDPLLPEKLLNIALPPDVIFDSLVVEAVNLETEELDGAFQVPPAPPAVTWVDGEMIRSWGENAEFIQDGRNTLVYSEDAFSPAAHVELLATSQMRKWLFAQLAFRPVQYNPASGQMHLVRRATIRLSYQTGSIAQDVVLGDTQMDEVAAGLFDNYDTASQWYRPDGPQPFVYSGYAIITTNAIQAGSTKLDDFVAHKQHQLGYNVMIITEDEYGSLTGQAPNGTAEKIRQWLKNNYLSQKIKYVLLIGNPDPDDPRDGGDTVGDVPMKMLFPNADVGYEESPSDYFYADLTGNWDRDGDGYFGEYPDDAGAGGVNFSNEVVVGRIPVYGGSYATLDSILQKTIDYETASPSGIAWRKSALLPMSYSDPSTDGARLAEAMKTNYLNRAGYASWTMYQQGSLCSAANSSYASDQELYGDTAVVERWSTNAYGIVNWWGHGSETEAAYGYSACGWGTLFDNTQVGPLDDSHPSFVYQCSCLNGYPEHTSNLGYSILTDGGIGTVSASRVSWYAVGTWSPRTTYADNASIGYNWHREMVANSRPAGDALYMVKVAQGNGWWGASYMNKYDFNLYGDPSTKLTSAQSAVPAPARPVLASPISNYLTSDTTPELAWLSAQYAFTYQVQIDTTATFAAPLVQDTEGISGLSLAANALPDGKYYWRVRAKNISDVYSPWSLARYFTVDTTPPAAPLLSLPADGAQPVGIPTFSWKTTPTGYRYQFQYGTDNLDPENYLYRTGELTTVSHKPADMAQMTWYYWFARAKDKAGNWSAWSAPFTVYVVPPKPKAPVLDTPASNSFTNDTTPELTWKSTLYAHTYQVQIDTAATFPAPLVQDTEGISGLSLTANALVDGKYYWRARARNLNNEYGPWSVARNFTVDTVAPAPPLLSLPADGAQPVGIPTFSWKTTPTGYRYQFQYGPGTDPNTYTYRSSVLTGTTHKPADMPQMTWHYWFARAMDKAGNWSAWSAPFTVMVVPPTPKAPVLTAPANGFETNLNTPQLTWNSVLYGNTYHVQIDDSSTFTAPLVQDTEGVSGLSLTTNVLQNGKYYWRVRAKNLNDVYGPWSLSRNFTVFAGFNSQFNGDATGWTRVSGGNWYVNSSEYYTDGVTYNWTTARQAGNASNFTFETRINRDSPDYGWSSGVMVRANSTFTSGYAFYYSEDYQDFSVWRYKNGAITNLQGWTYSSSIVEGWNKLKVVANGSSLALYFNDTLVWSGSDSNLTRGLVGLRMYRGSAIERMHVDWATLSLIGPLSIFESGPVEAGQIVLPVNSAEPHVPEHSPVR